ncbi:MAG: hypothetical protein ACT4OK_10990 [Gemmobacter sp.]
MPASVASEVRAGQIFNALDQDFALPPVDLSGSSYSLPTQTDNPIYGEVEKIDLDNLTDGTVGGDGTFEMLMASIRAHLQLEFEKNRITGEQYTKAYIELTSLAMSTGLQMVLGRQQAYWQTLLAREQAKRAEAEAVASVVALETAKAQLAAMRYQAEMAEAQMVLAKLQLASEDARYQLTHFQIDLTKEQIEVARAQHADTRTDGSAIAGTVKRQRDLLEQQREAFVRDADARVAKMYLDGWITQKTIDEGLTPPSQLTNAEIEEVMTQMRQRAGFTL